MKLHRTILTAGIALATLLTTGHSEVLPILEDTMGSATTRKILKSSGVAKALTVSKKSDVFINFGAGLSGIDPATVTAARLTLYFPTASKTGTLTIYNLDSEFSETFPEASRQGPTLGSILDAVDLAQLPLNKEFYIVDITAQVRAWLTDPASEHGIAIISDGTSSATLASKEGAGSGHPAVIEVDVTASALTTSFLSTGQFTAEQASIGNVLYSQDFILGPDAFQLTRIIQGDDTYGRLSLVNKQNSAISVRLNAGDGSIAATGQVSAGAFQTGGLIQGASLYANNQLRVGNLNPFTPEAALIAQPSVGPTMVLQGGDAEGAAIPQRSGLAFSYFDTNQAKHFITTNHSNTAANNKMSFWLNNNPTLRTDDTPGNGTTRVMTLTGSGNVGIGTNDPTRGRLEIADQSGLEPGYLGASVLRKNSEGGLSTPENVGAGPCSIWAAGGVFGSAFVAFSDERIKQIKGRSDANLDLSILRNIEITDYTFVDSIAKGTGEQKKVIAQQVAKVFPQAVSKTTDVVPDIYKKAAFSGGWVTLGADLGVGERVRLIGKTADSVVEILETKDGAFRTSFETEGNEVFVYGREVKDFHAVDYEAIAMLNVSATQELARMVEAKDEEIAALKEKLATLETGIAARLAKLEAAGSAPTAATAQSTGATIEVK